MGTSTKELTAHPTPTATTPSDGRSGSATRSQMIAVTVVARRIVDVSPTAYRYPALATETGPLTCNAKNATARTSATGAQRWPNTAGISGEIAPVAGARIAPVATAASASPRSTIVRPDSPTESSFAAAGNE